MNNSRVNRCFLVNVKEASAQSETAVIEKPPDSLRFEVSQGSPAPFGATLCDGGVNFAIFSAHSVSATLCLITLSDLQQVN